MESARGPCDNSSRVADLKKCWASFNTPPNQKYAFIAKRIVAREMVVELCFEGDARAEAAAAAVRNAAEIAFAPTTAGSRRRARVMMNPRC